MRKKGLTERLALMLQTARNLLAQSNSSSILILTETPLDWSCIREQAGPCKLLVAFAGKNPQSDELPGEDLGIRWIPLEYDNHPTLELLSLAMVEAVADDYLVRGDSVVALFSGFDANEIDSMSVIRLGEHLERLTARDLRKLETQVPLDTLKAVVDLAVEIGREGREGQPVGTLFVVGDTPKVMNYSRPIGYDPVKGYAKQERNLADRRVRESIKEIAKLDGAMIVDRNGIIRAASQLVNAPASGITLSKGLGTRHWAGAAVSKCTKAIAIVVSQSSGTVRIFQDGQIVLRIEPLARAMKWQEFDQG